MSFFRASASMMEATSTLIHRSGSDILGVREAIDDLTGLTVTAFPMTMVRDIIPARAMMTAAYVLSGLLSNRRRIYLGESSRIGRRLYDHSCDPSKGFAVEVFVITKCGLDPLDKTAALYLQAHLTRVAEDAGVITVQKGTGAQAIDPSLRHATTYFKMAKIAERLLFDAGCVAFQNHPAAPNTLPDDLSEPLAPISEDDAAPIEIGVLTRNAGTEEYQLAYGDLWARGCYADAGFVVTAGSELRRETNPSVNPILHARREELLDAGVLADIPGLRDRQRLTVSVWFPSPSIAAKVVTGAHVASNKWVPITDPGPFVLGT
ncbi:hypothetical protein JQ580_08435 [Bradyrhizobium japonicum]|uniref:hypothetical protein n=1 Tax=Bradyrhizobium japonicum TaxID=375 RepID=UPI001BAB4EEA|nr:hypothetical protein [Bradyrhizobium japonicum]MBR0990738.1 hypothetical protein [Bradyrhizobium japonicum]